MAGRFDRPNKSNLMSLLNFASFQTFMTRPNSPYLIVIAPHSNLPGSLHFNVILRPVPTLWGRMIRLTVKMRSSCCHGWARQAFVGWVWHNYPGPKMHYRSSMSSGAWLDCLCPAIPKLTKSVTNFLRMQNHISSKQRIPRNPHSFRKFSPVFQPHVYIYLNSFPNLTVSHRLCTYYSMVKISFTLLSFHFIQDKTAQEKNLLSLVHVSKQIGVFLLYIPIISMQ